MNKINKKLASSIQVNQWKNSSAVIKWFKKIQNKNNCSFIVFDIENFYPSISLTLFNNAVQFVKEICDVPDNYISIIMHARNKLLFSNSETWVKKDGDENFNVPIDCYDGAEICELIRTYLLYQINNVISKENMGLYRDDRLGMFRNMYGPEVERKKKTLIRTFKSNGLSITVKTNLKVADFLDIYFEIVQDIYQPYKKPNNEPLYINKNSNHLPTVIKQKPKAISNFIK